MSENKCHSFLYKGKKVDIHDVENLTGHPEHDNTKTIVVNGGVIFFRVATSENAEKYAKRFIDYTTSWQYQVRRPYYFVLQKAILYGWYATRDVNYYLSKWLSRWCNMENGVVPTSVFMWFYDKTHN